MAFGVRIHVSGARACFTRPELKVERVSYDVMTPSAARGILEAIHWKPAIAWAIDRIHVLEPIRFQTIRRNEVGHKVPMGKVRAAMKAGSLDGLEQRVEEDRQQRAATILVDVAYVIEAHFDLTPAAGPEETEGKHLDIFNRRARRGQCFHQPYLGTREFPANVSLLAPDAAVPPGKGGGAGGVGDRDLGLMLYDIDHANGRTPMFFRARLRDGILDVPKPGAPEILR
ncbi:type I-C CRISPR-associated protein Cas5 [Marivibrio halodurans]|uniref:pre-crRNA processing endonuclease n=1 Tax=Marivibrio halodurans TaxID=2039722 RepID=A0A8J7RWD9_9PROT|nr:type I-C CRISPR-associated protein Cas5c [Marivibrio halodurans]MBP5855917.1 type I-C CRISPR-associated protein Cas5 [Marivibrio halodurans]